VTNEILLKISLGGPSTPLSAAEFFQEDTVSVNNCHGVTQQ